MLKNKPSTKTIAMISIFTALYAVLRIIPTVPMIGGSGASFSLSDVIAPIYGLILGPYLGSISVIIGSFLAMFGKPPVFLGLDFLPATVAAVSVGLLMKRKWIFVVALNFALLVAFLLHPNSSVFVEYSGITLPFAWLHILALVILISPLGHKIIQWIKTDNTTKMILGIAIIFFIGTMMQHLMGNLLYETIMAQPIGSIPIEAYPANWLIVFPLYPIERIALVFFGTIIGTPLMKILPKTFLLSED
jgi:hypothetical protein